MTFAAWRGPGLAAGFLGLSLLATGAPDVPPNPVYAPVKSMSPEELAKTMGDQKKYEFDLAPVDGLIDSSGILIRAEALPAYLREHALAKDAYYILWITADSPPLNRLAPTVKPLGDYGVTKIVVRARPGVTPKTAPPPDNAARKTVLIQGKPNPGAIDSRAPFPALDGRPPELRPEPLPPHVRYKFAPDAEMIAAVQALSAHFLAAPPATGKWAADGVIVQPGAWKLVSGSAFKEAKSMDSVIPVAAGRQIKFEGARLQKESDLTLLGDELRQVIQADGGGNVRTLRGAEMAKWWTFIGFDIEEPTLVLETSGGKHRFIFGFAKGSVLSVDELNGLPDKL